MIQSSFLKSLRDGFEFDILITEDSKEAFLAYEAARFFGKDGSLEPILLPDLRAKSGDDLRSYSEELSVFFSALREFYDNRLLENPSKEKLSTSPDIKIYEKKNNSPRKILISPISSLLIKAPKPELLESFSIKISDRLELDSLKHRLINYGYESVDIVELEGEVSFRGDIIDIFPPSANSPFRISLFDVEVESIREFFVDTQKCANEEKDSILIYPALFSLTDAQYSTLKKRVEDSDSDVLMRDIRSIGMWHLDSEMTMYLSEAFRGCITESALKELKDIYELDSELLKDGLALSHFLSMKKLEVTSGYRDILVDPKNIDSIIELNRQKSITLISKNQAQIKIANLADYKNISIVESDFVVNVETPKELIISLNRYVKKEKRKKSTLVLDELKVGDYVVHCNYGVGIFSSIEQVRVLGSVRDFIRISYQGEDNLLLPVENLNMIDRYVANSGSIPMVDRLGKGSFARVKEKAREKQ